ncbi:MBL fold metallo-hydrolase [Sphingomonas arantia]|uniref:MBL fold metallo-hydrolase n=1 Tax=Sphingomonas arantia TaxID=1460676 RepID=A0ABW4TVI8_9SPHN
MIHLCSTCGTSFDTPDGPPPRCAVCCDERQFVPPTGQCWTTPIALHSTHGNRWRQHAPGLLSFHTVPRFAIGQRAFLLLSPHGNILWDCVACLDPATRTLIQALGGIRTIALSHPHYYTTMQDWADAFDATIHLHADDRQWVSRDSPRIAYWTGGNHRLAPDIEIVRLGGHFPGGSVLHLAQDDGILLASDILQVTPGADRVSFMWSYPNLLPLSRRTVETIATRIGGYAFDQLHGAFEGQHIPRDARAVVLRSAEVYCRCLKESGPS